ncbi:hypothetical protein DMENIID0001_009140 [Sergentomyia squamirostris]
MKKSEYETKMTEIVSDQTKYKPTRTSNTITAENKSNALVMRLYKEKHINLITRRQLTTHNSRTPRMYGQPKIHKPNTPLREIVSCIKAPTYKLSKFLNGLLAPVANKDQYSVKDSYEFVQRIQQIQVPPDYIMISLDVVALFPNIPRQLALDIAKEQWDIIKEHTPIGMNLFMSILKHCLEHSRFVYNGQNYMQIDGMPMGGPLSPIIADLVMNYALTKITQELNVNILCLTKYVDDIFCLVPKDKVAYIQESFNAFHPKLQFTVELEKENSIAFLDTYVTRRETKLVSIWYKKPIASDRMLNYFSNHTLTQKIATAIGFIKRVRRLTTAEPDNTKSIVFSRLRMNGFPTGLINLLWQKHARNPNITESINKKEPTTTSNENTDQDIKIIHKSITYVRGMSERIKSLLKPIQQLRLSYKSDHSRTDTDTISGNYKSILHRLIERDENREKEETYYNCHSTS